MEISHSVIIRMCCIRQDRISANHSQFWSNLKWVAGLEDQLLSRVILAEKRELETGRTKLVTDITANKRKIQELEANLLHKLTTVQVWDYGRIYILSLIYGYLHTFKLGISTR